VGVNWPFAVVKGFARNDETSMGLWVRSASAGSSSFPRTMGPMASATVSITRSSIDRFHPHGVKQHTAFVARDRAEVDAFHAAALKAGGTDNGPPGLRDTAKGYPPGYYAAPVLDPDGNNIEAVFRGT
jgi:catechol 2,3-dioxygenase-like lactoylglutathione lyase family enzyme